MESSHRDDDDDVVRARDGGAGDLARARPRRPARVDDDGVVRARLRGGRDERRAGERRGAPSEGERGDDARGDAGGGRDDAVRATVGAGSDAVRGRDVAGDGGGGARDGATADLRGGELRDGTDRSARARAESVAVGDVVD